MADTTAPILHTRLVALLTASERLRRTAPVDDDFPEMMHNHDSAMRAAREALDAAGGVAPFDLVAHLHRQRAFSERTFGPGARTAGVLDHIRKELAEVEAAPGDVSEWVDLVILALDGAWRAGHEPQAIVDALVAKQTRNESRTWPDWRTVDPTKAIEHDRTGEPPAGPDQDTMVDASDDPAAMSAALLELARELGCDCNLDDMLHAIDKLQRDAEDVDGLRDQLEQVRARGVDALRTLWLVVRFAGGPKGVIINRHDAAMVDWSRCSLARENQLADMGVRLRAVDNGSGLGDDAVREFGWRKQPQHQAMHQQLLDMLGAIDHQGAAGRIGELVGLELLLNAGGAGRGVTAIAQERRGQIEREGYAPNEDDAYTAGELAQAACAYITWEWSEAHDRDRHLALHWPMGWDLAGFKPKDRRSDLVRAGALLAAEIDRLDRKAAGHG